MLFLQRLAIVLRIASYPFDLHSSRHLEFAPAVGAARLGTAFEPRPLAVLVALAAPVERMHD
jgi:hypothetical protein